MEPREQLPEPSTEQKLQSWRVAHLWQKLTIFLVIVVVVLVLFTVLSPKQSQKVGEPCICPGHEGYPAQTGTVWYSGIAETFYCRCPGLSGT